MILNKLVVAKTDCNKYKIGIKRNRGTEVIAFVAMPVNNDDMKNVEALNKICKILCKEWNVK